jgi:hypothetical protein
MKQKLKAAVWLVVIAAALYLGWKIVPPYFYSYQFNDEVRQLAMGESYTGHDETQIRAKVLMTARQYNIPLDPNNVKVMRNGAEVDITVDYVWHVDVPIHPFDISYHTDAKNTAM